MQEGRSHRPDPLQAQRVFQQQRAPRAGEGGGARPARVRAAEAGWATVVQGRTAMTRGVGTRREGIQVEGRESPQQG